MTIKVDVDAIAQTIEARRAEKLPSALVRARHDLSEVLDHTMPLDELYGTIQVMAAKFQHVRDHLQDIKAHEVMQTTVHVNVPGKSKGPGKSRKTEVDAAVHALKSYLQSRKCKEGRTDICTAVLASNTGMSERILNTAWGKIRKDLKDEGKGPVKRYWLCP